MQDQPRRSIPVGMIAGLSALVLATGGGVAWWTWKSQSPATAPSAIGQIQPSQDGNSSAANDPASRKPQVGSPSATAEKTLQVYWLKASGNTIALAPSTVKLTSNGSEALLEAAMKQLLVGPTPSDVSTTIPSGTKLRDLAIAADGIHVDLSREFTSGGGSSSMQGRLAQVLYTATSLNPDAAVWLSVEGKPLETLGGEGLSLPQPMTRTQFQQDFGL